MKEIIQKYKKPAAGSLGAVLLLFLIIIANATKSGKDEAEVQENGPQQVAEAFFSALTCGDWDRAATYCDTTALAYISAFRNSVEDLQRKEPEAFSIIPEMLHIDVDVRQQSRKECSLCCRIALTGDAIPGQDICPEGAENNIKEKTVELRKEDKEWIITGITGL